MPITLNHSNIGVQYSSDKSYIIETVKSDLYLKNEIIDTITRDNIQAAPVTPSIYIENGTNNVYAVESYTYSGTANTADFTRVFTKSTTCDILIVGGGGGGGQQNAGGGGAGGLVLVQNLQANGSFTINVGKGGNGGLLESRGSVGNNSTFTKSDNSVIITANGGGGGGSTGLSGHGDGLLASNGGSGGGGGYYLANGTQTQKSQSQIGVSAPAIINQFGEDGGHGGGSTASYPGGGGGGAGGVGATSASNTTGQNGGLGIDRVGTFVFNEKFSSSVGDNGWFAGGGGSGGDGASDGYGNGGSSLFGGGGNGDGIGGRINGINGTGGGGGALRDPGLAGNGGSGIVIIRYLLGTIPATNFLTTEPSIIAATTTFTETIRSFAHSGGAEAQTTHTITVGRDIICDILVVGGGGGGGNGDGSSNEPGGGGAGGIVYMINKTLNAGTYKINVGKGGASNTNGNNSTITYSNDNNITFDNIQLIGRGGGKGATTASQTGSDGGSGGGGGHDRTNGGLATQGNTFWNGTSYVAGGYNGGKATAGGRGGGGGGAGEVGSADGDGYGGDGVQVNITGTNTFYAGGGNAFPNRTTTQSDGGGGLVPATGNPINGGNALPNTGSGGAGAYGGVGGSGGAGGSGIVIIKFKSLAGPILEGIAHKRLNFTYTPNYPFIQADNTNLKAWYKFDDDFNDSSGNNSHLTTLQGTPTLSATQFKIGKSSFLTNSALKTNGFTFHNKAFAIACWVYQTEHGFILAQHKSAAANQSFHIYFGDIYRFGFYANDLDTASVYNGDINNWVHLVFQIDTNRNREIWRNGVRVINDTSATFLNTDNNDVVVGNWVGTGIVSNSFGGYIDDMRFYDRALTSTEISQLYNIPTTNQYTLNFPVPTIADINNNSNIVLRGSYDLALSTSNALIIAKAGQYIPPPTTFTNYSIERMYPPVRNFTAATTTVSGQTYGNGTYVVSFSSSTGGYEPWTCFNTSAPLGGYWADNRYTSGAFNSTSFIVAGYLGDWLKIQLPVAIKLTKFGFLARTDLDYEKLSPKDFKIYGSNDNITWVELVNKTDTVYYNASSIYEQTTPEITNAYTYYGLVVNKIFSDGYVLNFDEWYIYGQEVLPSSLSIRYNLLNPTLDPVGAQWTYNTSNTNVYHMGNVGIGTKSPEYSLDVSGSVNAKMLMYNGSSFNSLGLSIGMIAQVQHLTYTHMEVKNNTGWDAINEDLASGFVIKITPKSSLSKMLVNLIVFIGMSTSADNAWWGIKLYRKIGTGSWTEITGCNGTETGSAAATAGTPVWISNNTGMVSYNESITNASGTYLDSPNTTATVYYTAYWNQRLGDNPSVTGQMFLNRANLQNDANRPAPSSSWTVEEIWYG
jgi:hypothetical protein